MTSDRIREIQEGTAYPESLSVMLALKQVWNECAQESMYSEEEVWGILLKVWEATGNLKSTEYRLIKPFDLINLI